MLENKAVHHRLSWFVTLQSLLFVAFVLIDKTEHMLLTSGLVCSAVAMCLPGIASAYSRAGIHSRMRVALALLWATLGTTQLMLIAS